NLQGKRIANLRSDNGGEYKSNAFEEYLKTNGINHEVTIPGTPGQNGVSERFNMTLMNAARFMILESGMPETFWADTVATACYVINRCPTVANGGETPMKRWRPVKNDAISHLRVFGCRAWGMNKHPKNKLAPRAIPSI